MVTKKTSTHSIAQDFTDFTQYVKHCAFGTLKRFSKIDAIILISILFGVIVIHHLLVINYILIQQSIDLLIDTYDELAKLINLLIPVLNELIKLVLDIIKAVASFIGISSISSLASDLSKIRLPKLPQISVSDVNEFLLAFKNSKVFLQGSTIKALFARFVGDRTCFVARFWDGTVLEFVSEILKFVTFYGGYKPIPNDPDENCNIQISTPFYSETYVDIILFIIQAVMFFIVLFLFFAFYKVLKNPRIYDI